MSGISDPSFQDRFDELVARCGVYKPLSIELHRDPTQDRAVIFVPYHDSYGELDGGKKETVFRVKPR